tara:strand:+ start:1015 stop:1833 length:819 start_codon:yes stop_codon:yes gene_type:complete
MKNIKKNKKSIFISNLAWNKNNDMIIKKLENYGFSGIDFAPLQITNNWNNIKEKVKKYYTYLKKNKIKVNAVQGIFFKKKLNVFQQSQDSVDIIKHFKIIIKLCQILKCNKIILGSTTFRNKLNLNKKSADKIFFNFLKSILPLLKKNKIFLCLETIPKQYNEKYLYNFKDVVNIVRKINSKWIAINYDTSVFHYNKINLLEFNKNIKLIKNIQISEKNFSFFLNPSKKNIKFCDELRKNNKIKNVSFEIISEDTNLDRLNLSIENIRKLFN